MANVGLKPAGDQPRVSARDVASASANGGVNYKNYTRDSSKGLGRTETRNLSRGLTRRS